MNSFPLYVSALVASAVVMGLEIMGLGMLAPYFGTALPVQTNVIGVVLISLALGYRYAGLRADRGIQHKDIWFLLLSAIVWIGLVFPFRDIIGAYVGTHIFSVSLGSFIVATLLFGYPTVVLGMVLPYTIKLHVQTLDTSGKTSGIIYGAGALGSIFGTLAVAFFLLPYGGYESTLIALSVLLALSAYALMRDVLRVGVCLLFAVCMLTFVPIPEIKLHRNPVFSDGKIESDITAWKKLADTTGIFSRLQVYEGTEAGTGRTLRFLVVNGEVHSATYIDSNELVFKYALYNRLGGHFNPAAKKALLIGGGGYSYVNHFLTDTPLYDTEKVWGFEGKLYHNNKTVSLPFLLTSDTYKQKISPSLLYAATSGTSAALREGAANSLLIENQSPRTSVTVARADIHDTGFETSQGYVHIHETRADGTPGRIISPDMPLRERIMRPRSIIGKGPLIEGRAENIVVELDREGEEGEVLFAMLHRDNGNGHFDDFLVDGYEQIESLDVVEIDPRTTELAEEFFHLNRSDPRLRIFHEDGRTYINRSTDTYDIIYLDAFRSFYAVPWQLTTIEAMTGVFNMLNDGGVVVANIPAALGGAHSDFFQAELKTYRAVFPHVRVYASSDPHNETMVQNIILVAFKDKKDIRDFPNDDPSINEQLTHEWNGKIEEETRILTDKYAPTDYFTGKFSDLHLF